MQFAIASYEFHRQEANRQWAPGIALWLDRWTPYCFDPEHLVRASDGDLANVMIAVWNAGRAIVA